MRVVTVKENGQYEIRELTEPAELMDELKALRSELEVIKGLVMTAPRPSAASEVNQVIITHRKRTQRIRPFEQKVIDAIRAGKRHTSELAKHFSGSGLVGLVERKLIMRVKIKPSPKEWMKFYYYLPDEKPPILIDEAAKPLSTAPKGNPFELSVMDYAKKLRIAVTTLAVAELAKYPDWNTILQHAAKEGIYYMGAREVGYFRGKLHAPVKEGDNLESVKLTVTSSKETKPFLVPIQIVKMLGENAPDDVMRFIKEHEEAQRIELKEWVTLLYGLELKESKQLWYDWFLPNSRWMVKRALNYEVTTKIEENYTVLRWV